MFDKTPPHLSDRELLLAGDGELPPRHRQHAEDHLRECVSCATRAAELERQLVDSRALTECAVPLPPAGPARMRLQSGLAAMRDESRPTVSGLSGVWAFGAAVAVAVLGITWLLDARSAGTHDAVFVLPQPELTPGSARLVAMTEICGDTRTARVQPIPPSVQRRVYASYGADLQRSSEYELDYLITPELGGTPEPGNLWPQPFARTRWNAYVKDELELYLHELVCSGQMDLPSAQREIATDWIAAYKRHFATDTPRRDYAESPLTAGDADMLRAELEERGLPVPANSDGLTMLAMLRAPELERSGRRWFAPGE